ncbi:hypothetical protein BKA64DRAFT_689626 [Cadophora sp. MPI-SDFR-AT-0126]|nr:hypothetical protein BKA64DRAFT_689626 [Leotiomycetes sp. MPI-SDFR-AT-0126]
MTTSRIEQVDEQRQLMRSAAPERPTIIIPETWGLEAQEASGPKPWDLEVIRNERDARRKAQFPEASYISSHQHRQSLGSRTDGGIDNKDGPVENPFLDPADNIAPDDCSGVRTVVTPNGTVAVPRSPPPERKSSKGKRRHPGTRYQGPHSFVSGQIRHKTPGEVNRKHYTQYVDSKMHTDNAMTHHYLCETSDLEKPVYYYHDVGEYTRLDHNHRFTLHLGNHSGAPVLGAIWYSSSGIHFAVGDPFMNFMDKDNENVTTIQRQHCGYLKPISSASSWHMDFTFGDGGGEGSKRHYR